MPGKTSERSEKLQFREEIAQERLTLQQWMWIKRLKDTGITNSEIIVICNELDRESGYYG